MLSTLLGPVARRWALRVGRSLHRYGVSPNALTVSGFLLSAFVAWVLSGGNYLAGGLLTLFAGSFDMLDGAVARAGNRVSVFGGFLDSTLDRYSEAVLLLGLVVHFLRTGNDTAVVLTYLTIIGSLMISYTRARSEAAGLKNESGLLARPERVVLLGVLLVLGAPVIALWILAVLTNFTAAQRVYHVYKATGVS
ncbi:MAG: CDP-alcohol phosphatidyltransferase family protein [Chloroflexota bacterium]|nr:CDP-alcohol phosphatidyltransferase family protein [Chloroflexota bacterium]